MTDPPSPSSTSAYARILFRLAFERRYLIPVALAVCAFVIDLETPQGLIDGYLYVIVVLSCIFVPGKRSALYTASGLMIPLTVGFILSPAGAPVWTSMTNRLVSLVAIWLAAWVVSKNSRVGDRTDQQVTELKRRLSDAECTATQHRDKLFTWLNQELCPELQLIDWQLNNLPRRVRRSSDLQTESLMLRQMVERAYQAARAKANELRNAALEFDGEAADSSNRYPTSSQGRALAAHDQEPFGGY